MRFPRCRGRREGFTPHLTPGPQPRSATRLAAECAAGSTACRRGSGELVLLSRRGDEPMRARATVALGTGEVRWTSTRPRPDADHGPPDDAVRPADPARLADALRPTASSHVVGSRRMGCALPGADLDLVAALPGAADLADVGRRVRGARCRRPPGCAR